MPRIPPKTPWILAAWLNRALILLVMTAAAPSWGQPDALPRAVPWSGLLLERQKARAQAADFAQMAEALDIKKGMVILDIGTGSGQYAYQFASFLDGTGTVYATDVNPDMVHYVDSQARLRHLRNLVPVLVKAAGGDDFYSRQRYDLIFLAHVLEYIPQPEVFFKRLKLCINPHGRLVLLRYKYIHPFTVEDFTDVKGLLKKIVALTPQSPFYEHLKALRPQAQNILATGTAADDFMPKLAGCFNAMALDSHFFVPFLDKQGLKLDKSVVILPAERAFIDFNFNFLKEYGVLDVRRGVNLGSPHLNQVNFYVMKSANQMLILSAFQPYMFAGQSPFLPGGNVEGQINSLRAQFLPWGFRLTRVYDFIPNEILAVFSPEAG